MDDKKARVEIEKLVESLLQKVRQGVAVVMMIAIVIVIGVVLIIIKITLTFTSVI